MHADQRPKFQITAAKPIDSYWFEMSSLSCSVFICVHCFFLKMMKLYKDICSAWISRTSADFFLHMLKSETFQKYNRSIFILRRWFLESDLQKRRKKQQHSFHNKHNYIVRVTDILKFYFVYIVKVCLFFKKQSLCLYSSVYV